jgi:hypothetical protein
MWLPKEVLVPLFEKVKSLGVKTITTPYVRNFGLGQLQHVLFSSYFPTDNCSNELEPKRHLLSRPYTSSAFLTPCFSSRTHQWQPPQIAASSWKAILIFSRPLLQILKWPCLSCGLPRRTGHSITMFSRHRLPFEQQCLHRVRDAANPSVEQEYV